MKQETAIEMFLKSVALFPDNVAIKCGSRLVTYADLKTRAEEVVGLLRSTGTPRGSIVGILAEDRIDVIGAMLGALGAGCAFMCLDPLFPNKRLKSMVTEVPPDVFVTESSAEHRIAGLLDDGADRARVIVLDAEAPSNATEAVEADAEKRKAPICKYESWTPPGPDDLCSIYFTSGSSGEPKGIAGRLKGIDHFVNWEIENVKIGEGTRVSQLTSPVFDGFLKDVLVPLCAGGVVCVPEDRALVIDSGRLIEWIDQENINVLHCVPSVFRSIINDHLESGCFASLNCVVLAGEPLMVSDVSKWLSHCGDRIRLINLYGPTETTLTKLAYFVSPSDTERKSIPIGKPMKGATAIVVDPKGRPCATGVVGEIYIRTPFRSLGYYGKPEITSEVFIKNPFSDDPGDIVYKTGDFGRVLEDGNFEFLGRKDHQVKIRGVRVELGEIENLLLEHESVADCVVVDREDSIGNKFLCAYVVLKGKLESGALRDHLSSSLPDYLVPSAVVVMDALPRTLSGKVDRLALPAPDRDRLELGAKYVAPRTEVEAGLTDIWAEVLNVQKIGVQDNFLELGGNSLLAIQLIYRARETFEVDLPLRSLFETLTVAGMAERIETLRQSERDILSSPRTEADHEVGEL